jgi:hypothetical protein
MVGGGGNNLAKALSNAYVFGFKGTAGVYTIHSTQQTHENRAHAWKSW